MTRVLRVLVGALGVEDGQIAPPVVGEVARFELTFSERPGDEPDATVGTVRARAEPHSAAGPRQAPPGAGHTHPPTWSTALHGDGWSATWYAHRPVLGEVELRGVLVADLGPGVSSGPTRGRITRGRVVAETYLRTGPRTEDWRRDPTAQRLTDVDVGPRWFDDGLVPDPDDPPTGWGRMVHTDPWVRETGVLVDLDLDDAPPPPPRPSVVPGALSVHGDELWVLDEQLPLVVRVRDEQVVGTSTWPGGIASGRRVHADPTGAWVTGADGTLRVSPAGQVRQVSDERSWLATNSGTTLAVQVVLHPDDVRSATVLRLHQPGSPSRDVDLGGRHVAGISAVPGGFLLLVTPGDHHVGACSLAWLGLDGSAEVGPVVADESFDCHLVGGDRPTLARGGQVHPVLHDLTLGESVTVPSAITTVTTVGRTWTMHHPSDGTGPLQPWPEDWPVRHRHQHWVLTELAPATLEPLGSTPVPGIVRDVAVGEDGAVWTVAAGVRRCRGDGTPAQLLDVAALLDRSDHVPTWGWPDG